MHRHALVSIILLLACQQIMGPLCASSAPAHKGKQLSASEYNKAVFVFNKLNATDALIKSGNNVEARQVLERLITYDPNPYSGEVHGLLAQSCYDLGNDAECIEHYKIALRYNSKDLCAHWNIALSYMHLGDYDSAVSWAKKLLAASPPPALRHQAERFVDDMSEKKAELAAAVALPGASSNDYLAVLQAARDANRWPLERLPLKIFMADGQAVPNYRPQFRDIFIKCLDAWMKASQNRLAYVLIDSPQGADMLVQFTNRPADIAQKPGLAPIEQGIARTRLLASRDGGDAIIDQVQVQILVVKPASGVPCTDDAIKETCLHELGHALGLNGHSPNASDIMHFVQSFRQLPALTRRDKNTIARLYSNYPGSSATARSTYNQQNYGSAPAPDGAYQPLRPDLDAQINLPPNSAVRNRAENGAENKPQNSRENQGQNHSN